MALLRSTLLDARTMTQTQFMCGCTTVSLATVLEANCCASMECTVDTRDGQWPRSTKPRVRVVCSAHGAVPILLPVQRRIMRAELWAEQQAIILFEARSDVHHRLCSRTPRLGAWSKVVLSGGKTAC